ncbi:MAG: permease-like cell division protein FtsX [Desulfobacterales bacterium]|jgi:cell division transport system permease protein
MMIRFFKRAIDDILQNSFLNFVTIVTISLSILIASAFILFFINTSEITNSWKQGLRIIAYLTPDVRGNNRTQLEHSILSLEGVQAVEFISKQTAIAQLKSQLKHQSFLFEGLKENPLPDSFEIRMNASVGSWQKIETLATKIKTLVPVEEVEYGQRWLGRFIRIISLLRLAGYGMGGIFLVATVFIVANTIRLVIYSRREEVEIMRLVGATDSFIKIPFYIEGLIQGGLGASLGLGVLFGSFFFISSNIERTLLPDFFRLQFFSPSLIALILLGSMLVGWLGCYISLKQFLNS